jgi:hypothetical protein
MRNWASTTLARQVSWSRQRIPSGQVRTIYPYLLGIQELQAGCVETTALSPPFIPVMLRVWHQSMRDGPENCVGSRLNKCG